MTEAGSTSNAISGAVTVVTQTRVLPGFEDAFAVWQEQTSSIIDKLPGFLGQSIMRPAPPAQIDWVILQRFSSAEAAVNWLRSPERLARVSGAQSMLVGHDDVHIVPDGSAGVLPAPVSAIIATKVKPGQETAYRAWEQRIAAVQCKAPGFQGYRHEPPIPGVQDHWVSILRFDSEEHLNAWLASPERRALLVDIEPLTESVSTRVARSGFDQWFTQPAGKPAAVWKQNLIVLVLLYPIVFLFGISVQVPFLIGVLGLAFPVALFIGNVVSIAMLNYLVPWLSNRLSWWLNPDAPSRSVDVRGGLIIAAACLIMIAVFALAF